MKSLFFLLILTILPFKMAMAEECGVQAGGVPCYGGVMLLSIWLVWFNL